MSSSLTRLEVMFAILESSLDISLKKSLLQTTLENLSKGTYGVFSILELCNGVYVRIATTVPCTNGCYAIKTKLKDPAVIAALKSGTTFTGTTTIYDRQYEAIYKPVPNTKYAIFAGNLL